MPADRAVSVSLVQTLTDGTVERTDPVPVDLSMVRVDDLFTDALELVLIPSFAAAGVDRVIVDVEYDDPAHAYHRSLRRELPGRLHRAAAAADRAARPHAAYLPGAVHLHRPRHVRPAGVRGDQRGGAADPMSLLRTSPLRTSPLTSDPVGPAEPASLPSSLTSPSPVPPASPPSPRPSSNPRADELPASVARTIARLEAVRPQDARDAAHALALALEPVARSEWPEVAWRGSTLTGTGMPVEFAWSSRDAALRWTCEVGGPEVAESQRLAGCGEAAAALAGSPVELASWAALQQGRALRWGAWLGLRHLDAIRRAKVYVELPVGTVVPGPWAEVGERVTRLVPGLRWRMAGCNDDDSVELYARVPCLTVRSLASVAGVVGDPGRLVGLVGELLGRGRSWPGKPSRMAGSSAVLPPAVRGQRGAGRRGDAIGRELVRVREGDLVL